MEALGLSAWGRSAVWGNHPGGCFKDADNVVNLNQDPSGGAEKKNLTPICHKRKAKTEPADLIEEFEAKSLAAAPPFALGETGLNKCPSGYRSISDRSRCRDAMEALGLSAWGRSDVWGNHPGGCFKDADNVVNLNQDPSGG